MPKKKIEPPTEQEAKLGGALSFLNEALDKQIKDQMASTIETEVKELKDLIAKNAKLDVTLGDQTHTLQGLRHVQLPDLITVAALRLNALLVGMAGTGKTHAAEQTAEALGLDFYAMSVGAQTSKSDIIGYMNASGGYVRTHFRDAYEKGGVFLMDEIDAGNANVLIQVNAALSNGACAFPDAMVKRHPDFIFIASANTYGNGANRQYVGRNQLDAATIDRFTVIDWLIDEDLEQSLVTGKNGKKWLAAVRAAREYITSRTIRALVTPRATQKGAKLIEAGYAVNDVVGAVVLSSVPEDKKQEVLQVAVEAYDRAN